MEPLLLWDLNDLRAMRWLAIALPVPKPADVAPLLPLLGPEDRARHSSMSDRSAQWRFVLGRILLRRVMGHLIGVAPEQVPVTVAPGGKPQLGGDDPALGFSIAHCPSLVVLALCADARIGVDVEPNGRTVDEGTMRRVLSPAELALLDGMDRSERAAAFLHLWTVKEACAKALGTGVGTPLRAVEASLQPSGRWSNLAWEIVEVDDAVIASVATPATTCGRAGEVHKLSLERLTG